MFTSLLGRIVVVATVLTCSSVSAQLGGPTPNARQIRPQLPQGVRPRAGHGELYTLTTSTGAPQVVRLHCAIDPYALVMMPAGDLKVTELSKMKATSDPFVAAPQEQIIESLKAGRFSKYKFEKGKYGYLYAYDCSDAFFAHAQSILETMLPGVVGSLKSWGMTVKRPDVPMVVVIVPSRAAYDAIKPMPKEVIAYYNMNSNQIVMYEDQEMWDAAPEFAAKQAAYCIAHEGAHQLLGNIGVQQRLSGWAPWICEGLPEYYCPLRVNSNIVRKGNSELPARTLKWNKAGMVNDLRMWSLLKMPASSGKALESLVTANEIDADGYALAWGLVHYLATKKPEEFRAYLTDVSKYEPLDPKTQPLTGRPDPLFVKHFSGDFAALEKEIQAYLTSKSMQAEYVDPIENQTHYVVRSVEKIGHNHAVRLAITTSPAAAKDWKEKEEAANRKAHFTTTICKTKGEAERQLKKLQALAGR